MAGERKGKTYEALAKIALEELVKARKLKGKIFWNETPAGMSIEPDLLVGTDKDRPTHAFLITHSGAAGNSHMKFWRNMGELVEAKTCLPTVPRVFSIAFDSVIKADLKTLQEVAFDGQLIVGDLPYGKNIQKWVDDHQAGLPKDANEKVDAIRAATKGKAGPGNPKPLIDRLAKDIAQMLKTPPKPELEQFWAMERKRTKGQAPKARQTFVRRGLGKLLVFEDVGPIVDLYAGKRVSQTLVPRYGIDLGFVGLSIGSVKPTDREIKNAVQCLGPERAAAVVARAPIAKVQAWVTTLRHVPHLEVMGRYVIDHFDLLAQARELKRALLQLYRKPTALVSSGPAGWPPTTVWLLEYLVELVKAASGRANGFGYAQLGRQVMAAGYSRRTDGGNPRIWVGGFILSDWIRRGHSEALADNDLEGIAVVLSGHLRQIGARRVAELVRKVPPLVIKNTLEAKLLTYRGFEPLPTLIRESVREASLLRVDTAFAKAAALGGQAGKSRVLKAKETLINWQSVSDAGRDHKKKELMGRAVALRYTWNAKMKRYTTRPGVKKLILVVDGTWKQEDLDALVRAGWDEIFYPDEMDKLAKAVV